MSPNPPKVTVIVSSYNYGRFLPAMCRSLLAQTYPHFEVLIGDDCSTDNSREALVPYLVDKRFRLITWSPNRGMTAGWLALLDRVDGEYYCPMAADDEWEPDFLERRVAMMEQHPHAALVHGRTRLINENGQPLGDLPQHADYVALHRILYDRLDRLPPVLSNAEAMSLLLQHDIVAATSTMIRTSASRRVLSALQFDWVFATDWSHWLLHLSTLGDVVYDPRPLTRYRVHGSSLTGSPSKLAMREAEARLVPLWALAAAAGLSSHSTVLWMRWRRALYCLWLRRAVKLARAGMLRDDWLQVAALAFYGRGCSRVSLWTEVARHAAGIAWFGMQESAARRRQLFVVSGLALVQHPFFDREAPSAAVRQV